MRLSSRKRADSVSDPSASRRRRSLLKSSDQERNHHFSGSSGGYCALRAHSGALSRAQACAGGSPSAGSPRCWCSSRFRCFSLWRSLKARQRPARPAPTRPRSSPTASSPARSWPGTACWGTAPPRSRPRRPAPGRSACACRTPPGSSRRSPRASPHRSSTARRASGFASPPAPASRWSPRRATLRARLTCGISPTRAASTRSTSIRTPRPARSRSEPVPTPLPPIPGSTSRSSTRPIATGGARLYINDQTQSNWGVAGDYTRSANLQRLQLWNDGAEHHGLRRRLRRDACRSCERPRCADERHGRPGQRLGEPVVDGPVLGRRQPDHELPHHSVHRRERPDADRHGQQPDNAEHHRPRERHDVHVPRRRDQQRRDRPRFRSFAARHAARLLEHRLHRRLRVRKPVRVGRPTR